MFYKLATEESYVKNSVNLFVAFAPILRLGNTPNMALKLMAKGISLADNAM